MDTLTHALGRRRAAARRRAICRHATFQVSTHHPTQFVDLTDRLEQLVADAELRSGLVNVQTLHTTTAVVVNEHEPLLLADFQALLEAVAPGHGPYLHDDPAKRTVNLTEGERANGHAHCRALLLPTTACLNVTRGRLRLGRWQRVFFVELDGPRERHLSVAMFGEAGQ
jgi:secondary thiamine-phosphate synthase enzyme